MESELKDMVKLTPMDDKTVNVRFCDFVETLKIIGEALPLLNLSKNGSKASKLLCIFLPMVFTLLDIICNSFDKTKTKIK